MPEPPNETDTLPILRWAAWSVGAGGLLALLTALWVMREGDEAVREAYRRDLPAFLLIWGILLSAVTTVYLLRRRR